jgi:hypothetical protein
MQARNTIHQSRKGGGKEMKKFIVLSILGLLIIAFSTTVYAQPKLQFTARGDIEVTTLYFRNAPWGQGGTFSTYFFVPNWPTSWGVSNSGEWNRRRAFIGECANIFFDFTIDKSLSGTIGFEMDSGGWGSPSGDMGAWNTDQKDVEIKHAYITFAVPGIPIPMTIRAGIQPLVERPNMFLYTDGGAVTGTIKLDPVTIGLTWAKAFEGKAAVADDADVYGLSARAKFGPMSAGGYVYYYNMNTYPLQQSTISYGSTYTYSADMWWIGVNSDGKLGPINYNFDFIFDTGEVSYRKSAATALPAGAKRDVDYSGFATQLKITYPWEKFAFGVLGTYATGADLNKTSTSGFPGSSVAGVGTFTSKVGSYVIPPGSEQWAIWGESMVVNCNYISGGPAYPPTMSPLTSYSANMTRGALGGLWIAKLFASVSPVPWYKVTLQGMYIGDTTKHGNTLGDAVKPTGIRRDDNDVGWEVDLLNDIMIYKNLKWSLGGGILFAGDAMDQSNASGVTNESPKKPYMIATKLRYDF